MIGWLGGPWYVTKSIWAETRGVFRHKERHWKEKISCDGRVESPHAHRFFFYLFAVYMCNGVLRRWLVVQYDLVTCFVVSGMQTAFGSGEGGSGESCA